MEDCNHTTLLQESGIILCADCGKELQENLLHNKDWKQTKNDIRQSSHIKNYNNDSWIFSDIESMGYSKEILDKTLEIFNKVSVGKIYRGNMKNALLLASLYHVIRLNFEDYNNLSFNSVMKKFSTINKKCVTKSLKLINLKFAKIESQNGQNKYITAKELIKSYIISLNENKICTICHKQKALYSNPNLDIFSTSCELCKPKDSIKTIDHQNTAILSLYNQIKNKNIVLLKSRPQSLASSIIYYYYLNIRKNNPNTIFNIKEYIDCVQLSELTLNKLVIEFKKILE